MVQVSYQQHGKTFFDDITLNDKQDNIYNTLLRRYGAGITQVVITKWYD